MDLIKKLKPLTEQAEVVQLANEQTTINFEANKLKSSKVEETRGIAVRVVRNGRLGFAASSDMNALDKLVTNVLESAVYGDVVPIQFPGAQAAQPVITYDSQINDLPISQLVGFGQEMVDYLLSIEPEARINVSLSRGIQHLSLQNQAGANASYDRTPFSVGIDLTRIEGDDVLIIYDTIGMTVWGDDVMAPARKLGQKLERSRKITPIRSGKMPVVFTPAGSLVLGIPMMAGVDGKNVFSGISPIKEKIGEKIFDEKITLLDDGTLDGRFNSAPYDDEGIPHQANVLVDRGVLQGFLYDLKTAALSGAKSTGNASRSLFTPPSPSPTNLILGAGTTPLAEMIAGIDEGILVEDVLGLGQGNVISGAFSNPLALAFKIEKGEIVGRVKNASIADNIYDCLKNVGAVSQEREWVYNQFFAPYILLPEMNVVAKE